MAAGRRRREAPQAPASASSSVARLVTPSASLRTSFLAALAEYHAEGRHLELDVAGMPR
jgi:hypothetical protein